MRVMVITDNEYLYNSFKQIIADDYYSDITFDFFFSESNTLLKKKYMGLDFRPINLKRQINDVISVYELILSVHCKQIFPTELVNKIRCVNIHPGFNPYNRGWFPQVFSIINKLPIGVTIHEMDDQLDHGNIIIQKEVKICEWETSFDVYKKIQDTEIGLLKVHLRDILDNKYHAIAPEKEGNINLKKDFNSLCEINLDKMVTFKQAIDYLRAMTFKGYKNAYFYDEFGRKIFLEISLELEEKEWNEQK